MFRTYNTTHLALNDPSDATWALAYVRFALRDKPNDASAYPAGSLDDDELNAVLTARKLTDLMANGGDGTDYYVPHQVAAEIIEANPEFVERFSVSGYSEQVRSADSIARGIRRAGRWIDASIRASTSKRIGGTSIDVAL